MTLDSPISRLLPSMNASILALAVFLLFGSPTLANAAELPIDSIFQVEQPLERTDGLDLIYEPNFAPFDRSIIGRATPDLPSLVSNGPDSREIKPGDTICYEVKKKTIFGDGNKARDAPSDEGTDSDSEGHQNSRRAKSKTVYISANTCDTPSARGKDGKSTDVPQLVLYVSTSQKKKCLDLTKSDKSNEQLERVPFEEGAVMHSINATDSIYLTIAAPNITKYNGTWNYQIAVSLDEYYHTYVSDNTTTPLLWMDSDSTSALLVTQNLTSDSSETQTIMKKSPPYGIFVGDETLHSIAGLRHSACGLIRKAQIWSNSERTGRNDRLVTTGMTTRGPGQLPKQQFLLSGLNSSTSYSGILVKMTTSKSKRQNNSGFTVGGGGVVYRAANFSTSAGTNCKVVTDLEFCNETQYAVPGNDKKFNNTELAKLYDDYAKKMYANFEKVIAQIPCEAPPESRYSLARGCDDCREAYKRWLCTVTIPRCEDVMGGNNKSVIRNAFQAFPNGTKLPESWRKDLILKPFNNASRNAWIDDKVKPGPYKEILPCEDICYDVVQSCPAAIGFNCPQPGFASFDVSYGRRSEHGSDGVTCNYPGEARTKISAAGVVLPSALLLSIVPLMVWLGL
ncbi:hypothetical protein NM208_g12924 [Fusarium decemcellulare]|uniref:Uncharacterized protein n=1 Tax=Fusarium decemcellulare TaxID=57161 RepID=A0ACC1RM78_9HYPO|nr:hypothetical protein NM208_g12924 [Fusarium decemcellulare]